MQFVFHFAPPCCIIYEKEVSQMIKEEIWSVTLERARAFFRSQPDVTERAGQFSYNTAAVTLTELKPKGMGIWAAKRIKLRIEGGDEDVESIYHRFFIQFLSTGG